MIRHTRIWWVYTIVENTLFCVALFICGRVDWRLALGLLVYEIHRGFEKGREYIETAEQRAASSEPKGEG